MMNESKTYTYDENIVSDLHKEARGFRPSPNFYETWKFASDDDRQAIWDNLCREAEAAAIAENERQQANIVWFETMISKNKSLGAADRATAIRWIVDSLDLTETDMKNCGADYICYLLGLPYSMKHIFEEVI